MSEIIEYILNCLFYYTPEIVGIAFVINAFFQNKIRWDKATVCLVITSNIWHTFSNTFLTPYYGSIAETMSLVLIFLYAYYAFQAGVEKSLQILVGVQIIVILVELIVWLAVSMLVQMFFENNQMVNKYCIYGLAVGTLIGCYFIYKKCNITAVFSYVFEKNRVLGKVIVTLAVLCCISANLVRMRGGVIEMSELLMFMIFTILLVLTLFQWKKATELSQEKDKRMLIQQMCQESYEQLILEVRNRQHEFQNHLAALQGMSYSCETIEELSQLQGRYCDEIMEKNKYNKLLYACNSPILGGFLYSKFSKAEEKGIATDYQVAKDIETDKIEVFELIEMLGILYDNAMEALEQAQEKKIYVSLVKEEKQLVISVENISPHLSSKEISSFFQQGFSTKGKERGLGLAKLKKIVEKKKGRIVTQNIEKEEKNWISFSIYLA